MSRSLALGSLRQKDFCKFEVRLPYIHSEFQASQAVYKCLSAIFFVFIFDFKSSHIFKKYRRKERSVSYVKSILLTHCH